MRYTDVVPGIFIARPNRFIALCSVDGQEQVCHVKNTGRCKELLVPGCRVYLQRSHDPARKTGFDLIAVKKSDRLINMDSQAPNRAAAEWLPCQLPTGSELQAEYPFGHARIDFYAQAGERRYLIEVKGVTLEQDGLALFPDAPTERGVKHLLTLTQAAAAGWQAIILFVIQMQSVRAFAPNRSTHPAFADALVRAAAGGVALWAYDCIVTPDSMCLRAPVPILL